MGKKKKSSGLYHIIERFMGFCIGKLLKTFSYEQFLDDAKRSSIKKKLIVGVTKALQVFLMYNLFAFGTCSLLYSALLCIHRCFLPKGFWYGTKLIHEEHYTIGTVYTVSIRTYSIKRLSIYLSIRTLRVQSA